MFSASLHMQGCYPARYKINNVITKGKPVPLNQNHSHFIFIDNGLRNEPAYGGEIMMRAKIEGAIQAPVTGNTWLFQQRDSVDLVF